MDKLGFTYQETRDGAVRIARDGRVVTTLRGPAARKFLAAAAAADDATVQQLCARVTGNYRRGNEAAAREHPRNRQP